MIASPGGEELVHACERRLGRVVEVASVFYVRRAVSPNGRFGSPKPMRVVLALTSDALYLLEFRYWLFGLSIGSVLSRLPRHGAVPHCRHRWWAWPSPWRVDLAWPELVLLVVGELPGGPDSDRIVGLLASDEFEDQVLRQAASRG